MNDRPLPAFDPEPQFDDAAAAELERQLAGGVPSPDVVDDDWDNDSPHDDESGPRVPKRPTPTAGGPAAAVPEDDAE